MCECRARARNVLRVVIWRLPRASADLLRIEEKGIEFGASVKKKLSSIRGLPSLRKVVVFSWWFPWSSRWLMALFCRSRARKEHAEEKIKKFVLCVLLRQYATCALFVLSCTLVIYIHK